MSAALPLFAAPDAWRWTAESQQGGARPKRPYWLATSVSFWVVLSVVTAPLADKQ